MNRDELIQQVKEKYAGIASAESQQHFHQTTTEITAEAYYEKLLQCVINEISRGTFDNVRSADEVINKVAADKSVLSQWK
ncbi:hypothetical protein [Ruminococcus sp. Marseille-P6503]|jgi:hypothetical protein|uniref:hypothetical protein n=1 Tax=Ruminococcus sp. Marseille-P6503 TaxID=2364796 RepID=UPI000F52B56C|nr:hypothetical protein [Ruminococcus sp. Marseille-P6503]